jgi:TonB family protein
MHEPLSPRSPILWCTRAIVLAILTISYGGAFYVIAHTRTLPSPHASGPPMFTPVVSTGGKQRGGMTDSERLRSVEQEQSGNQEQVAPPARYWKFPVIDLLPSAPGWASTLSDLTPVTDAEPDPSVTQAPNLENPSATELVPARSILRMIRWARPVYYPVQCNTLRVDGPLMLDLQIDQAGRPDKIKIARSSGSSQLDRTALNAARLWRFAPPLWKSRPLEVRARVELRFNC